MRVKSVPRRVNPNRNEKVYIVKNGEIFPDIVNTRKENFWEMENSNGLDLSTNKKVQIL